MSNIGVGRPAAAAGTNNSSMGVGSLLPGESFAAAAGANSSNIGVGRPSAGEMAAAAAKSNNGTSNSGGVSLRHGKWLSRLQELTTV